MNVTLILTCAGKGERAGFKENKLWQKIDGQTPIDKCLSTFKLSGKINQYIITASEEDYEKMLSLYGDFCLVVKGGKTRTQSVLNALDKTTSDIVLIHDGARPFVSIKTIDDCINHAKIYGGAIPVIPEKNTVIKSEDGKIVQSYIGKSELYQVQTPQGFKTELIKKAYELGGNKVFNDDGQVFLENADKLYLFSGDEKNVKLTYKNDFLSPIRFGTGFDCHKLVENRKLILGGIEIPHDKGLLGHSDADVLTHAIMDAILSALSLRDIGYHFSDKDPKYKDACSMNLLEKVLEMIKNEGYRVDSISATVMAEKPKLLPHIPKITENLAKALSLYTDKVGIGATTLEGLGFVGREEGICVHATAVLTLI